jgi:hypothetical protein
MKAISIFREYYEQKEEGIIEIGRGENKGVQEVERIAVKPNESHDTLVVTDRKKLI